MSLLKANDFWRPNQQYYTGERIKTLILHDDKFYVCTENHTSGIEFDATKFILVSGGGGGGLIPSGDWDIVNSTEAGASQNLPAVLSVGLDAVIIDNVVHANQPLVLFDFAGSGFFGFGATTTNNIINDFSTTKWVTIEGSNVSTYYQFFILYDNTNGISPISDILFDLLNGNPTNQNMFTCGIASFGSAPQVTLVYEGNGHSLTPLTGGGLNTTSHNNISVGINLSLGKIYFDNITDIHEYNIPTDLFANVSNLCLFVGGLKGGPIIGDTVSLINPDQINKPPLLEDLTTYITVPPLSATDGTIWKLTSNGTYDNIVVKTNDHVSFYDNLSKIFILPDNNAELDALTNSLVLVNDDITALQESVMTIQERAIIRGIIDYATHIPPSPLKGNTFLSSSITGDLTPYVLWVYTGTTWVDVNPKEGNIFNFSEFNIQIMYKLVNDSSRTYKHTKRTTNLNSNIINIVDLINETGNYHWYIINNVKPTGYITQGDCVQSNTISIDFNVYKDCLIDLYDVEYSTFNMSLNYIPTTDLFNIEPNTLYFTNSTNSIITIHFDNNYLSVAIPKAPLLSNNIDIPPNSQLVLNVRPIDKENHSINEYSIEYVSGSYVKSFACMLSTTGGEIIIINGADELYINIDDSFPLSIQIYIDRLTEGQTIHLIYNATSSNSDISFQIHHNGNDYSVYLPIINIGDKGNILRFSNSSFGVY